MADKVPNLSPVRIKETVVNPPELVMANLPEPPKLNKFGIKFKDCPDMVIDAVDRHDAWERYCKYCGIIETIHKPEIVLQGE